MDGSQEDTDVEGGTGIGGPGAVARTADGAASVTRERIVESVVNCVSAATDVPARELPPLYDSLDPGALDALVSADGHDVTITFRYAGTRVTCRSGGDVRVVLVDDG
jgi:hypothetical protein